MPLQLTTQRNSVCRRNAAHLQRATASSAPPLSRSSEMRVQAVAVVEAIQCHQGFGVGFVPASATAFETLGGSFALGLRRAAANLPATAAELRIANRFAPLGHVTQESIGRVSFAASKGGAPSQ